MLEDSKRESLRTTAARRKETDLAAVLGSVVEDLMARESLVAGLAAPRPVTL
jgi:hypothetical protein